MSSTATPTPSAKESKHPTSVFEWMQKHSVPVMIICFVCLFGFGVLWQISEWVGRGSESADRPPKVIGTFELGGKKFEIPFEEFVMNVPSRDLSDARIENNAAVGVAAVIKKRMVEELDVHVSEAEIQDALKTQVVEMVKMQNDQKFSAQKYAEYVERQYHITVDEFERRLAQEMPLARLAQELARGDFEMSLGEVYDHYKKANTKSKLRGVFFPLEEYTAKTKLATETVDGKDVLTADSRAKLEEWWKKLDDVKRRQYYRGGALLTAEGLGYKFNGKSDAELDADFNRTSELSKTTLAKLTELFVPSDADVAKLKRRFNRFRDAYGVAGDADIEKEFESRKARLVQEWKIVKLVKQIHSSIDAEVKAGRPVDFKEIAQKNNLNEINVSNMSVEALRKHPDYPGSWAGYFSITRDGDLMTHPHMVDGDAATGIDQGPADEVGKHVSIWRMKSKNANPDVVLNDVIEEARKGYETEESVRLRDDAVKAFEAKMDSVMSEKAKEFIAKVNQETKDAIAKEIQGLDAEKDKDRIESITKAQNAIGDSRIATEKDKYRTEAFEAAWADTTLPGLKVEQGFFRLAQVNSQYIRRRLPNDLEDAPKSDAPIADRIAAALRRDFHTDLADDPGSEKFVEKGKVSKVMDSATYPGIKGIAQLVEKKVPTVDEMFDQPDEMWLAENSAQEAAFKDRRKDPVSGNVWSLVNMKRVYKLESAWLDKRIADAQEREKKEAALIAEEQAKRNTAIRPNVPPITRTPLVTPPVTPTIDSQPTQK